MMIVVGTDFSNDAHGALAVAQRLSRSLSAQISVVYVKPHMDSPLPEEAEEWLAHASVAALDMVVKAGTPWLELLRYAEEHDADLICIAAHGTSGYQALAAGSNARRLLLRSTVPVVVAPSITGIKPFKESES